MKITITQKVTIRKREPEKGIRVSKPQANRRLPSERTRKTK